MKTLLRWVVLAVVVVWVVQDPASAASLAHTAWSWLTHAGQSLSKLTGNLG